MAPSRSARTESLPAWNAVDGNAGATTRGRKRQRTSTISSIAVPLQQQTIRRPDDPSWFTSMLEDFRNENHIAIVNADLPNMGRSLNTNEDPADLDGSTLHVIVDALAGQKIVTSNVQSEKIPTSIAGTNHGHFPLKNSVKVIMDLDELSKEQLIELLGSLQIDFDELQIADTMNTLVTGVVLKGVFLPNSAESTPTPSKPSKSDRDDLSALAHAVRSTFNHDGLLSSPHHVSSTISPVQRAALFSNTVKAILLQHKPHLHDRSTAYNANAFIHRASAFLPELETMISDTICSDEQKDENITMLWRLLMWIMKTSVAAGFKNKDFVWDKAGQEALARFDRLMKRIVNGKVELASPTLGACLVQHRYLDTRWMDRDFEILGAVSRKAAGSNACDTFMEQTRAWMRDFLRHAWDQVQRGRAHAEAGIIGKCLVQGCEICKQVDAGAYVRADESHARQAADEDAAGGASKEASSANEERTADDANGLQVDMSDKEQVLSALAALAGRTVEEVGERTVSELASLIASGRVDGSSRNPALSTSDELARLNTDSEKADDDAVEDSAVRLPDQHKMVASAETALCEMGRIVQKDVE